MIKRKLMEWGARYLPAEICGTILAVVSGMLAYQVAGNLLVSAVAGAWGENLGFYGYRVICECRHFFQANSSPSSRENAKSVFNLFKNLLFEFGPAEVLDSFLIRPLFMWLMPQCIGNMAVGLCIGKLLADVFFYIPTIICFEIQKRYLSVGPRNVS